jgi:hypothetical protein
VVNAAKGAGPDVTRRGRPSVVPAGQDQLLILVSSTLVGQVTLLAVGEAMPCVTGVELGSVVPTKT